MTEIKIEKVLPEEIVQLQNIGRQTFYETFSNDNSEENMSKYLEEEFSISKLIQELNQPQAVKISLR